MSDTPNTVRVKPWGEGQGDFVLINEDDFDAEVHELYEEPDAAPAGAATTDEPKVGKGPGGRWYIMRGKERVSEGFASEDEAKAALDAMQTAG